MQQTPPTHPTNAVSILNSATLLMAMIGMALVVLISNILVQFLYGDWLTYGAFTYPFAFLITDIVNRLYGLKAARKVIWVGFIVGVICSFIGSQIIGEFGPLVTLRIAIASGTAFLVAQMLDASIFRYLANRVWWFAPLASSLIASSIETILFFSLAFSATFSFIHPATDVSWANEIAPLLGVATEVPLWVSLGVADYMVKLSIALIALMPFRLTTRLLLNRATA